MRSRSVASLSSNLDCPSSWPSTIPAVTSSHFRYRRIAVDATEPSVSLPIRAHDHSRWACRSRAVSATSGVRSSTCSRGESAVSTCSPRVPSSPSESSRLGLGPSWLTSVSAQSGSSVAALGANSTLTAPRGARSMTASTSVIARSAIGAMVAIPAETTAGSKAALNTAWYELPAIDADAATRKIVTTKRRPLIVRLSV